MMSAFVLFVTIAVLALITNTASARTLLASDVSAIQSKIVSTFGLTPSYGAPCNAAVSSCSMGDTIGALVRLAFHDAAGNGGPNGCIDFVNTNDNNGLQTVVTKLNSLYTTNKYSTIISKADLYVLAANTAIQYASTATKNPIAVLDPTPGTLTLPFRYGRIDAATCNDAGALPPASFKWADLQTLFGTKMGMNIREIVAIMGAHSVGRCEWANSGINGGWTTTQSSFSNSYYKTFAGPAWENANKSNVWTVNSPRAQVLIKPDVELLFQTSSPASSSSVTCTVFSSFSSSSTCPLQAQSSGVVVAYANNIKYFYGNFSTAWKKMTEYGVASSLTNVGSPPTTTTVLSMAEDGQTIFEEAPYPAIHGHPDSALTALVSQYRSELVGSSVLVALVGAAVWWYTSLRSNANNIAAMKTINIHSNINDAVNDHLKDMPVTQQLVSSSEIEMREV